MSDLDVLDVRYSGRPPAGGEHAARCLRLVAFEGAVATKKTKRAPKTQPSKGTIPEQARRELEQSIGRKLTEAERNLALPWDFTMERAAVAVLDALPLLGELGEDILALYGEDLEFWRRHAPRDRGAPLQTSAQIALFFGGEPPFVNQPWRADGEPWTKRDQALLYVALSPASDRNDDGALEGAVALAQRAIKEAARRQKPRPLTPEKLQALRERFREAVLEDRCYREEREAKKAAALLRLLGE